MINESRPRRCRASVAILLSLAATLASGAEDAPAPSAESPASLFSVELGGADAELFVKGSWEASLTAQAALEFGEGAGGRLSSAQPLLFAQSPDLFLSFLLFKRYFVEAKVVDDLSQARYSFGYRGGETDLLRELRAGNDGISFFELPFISFGEGSYRSFGASASFRAEGFDGRAMLRYDQAARATKRFKGGSELTETAIAAYGFVRGRWFFTNEAPGSDLSLFAASASGAYRDGSGLAYRKLEIGEYSSSALTRFISLARASDTKLVAYYNGGSYTETDTVSISGVGACVLLYDPDRLDSPYNQVLCRYPTSADPDSSEAFVRDAGSGLRDAGYEVAIDSAGYAEVTRAGTEATPRSASYARPFEGDAAAGIDWIYTTDTELDEDDEPPYAPVSSREIVVQGASSVVAMTIDSDYIPGTVEVTRDGVADYAFAVDPSTYAVKLASPPGAYEVIAVSYLRESSERRTGSLAAGLGGIWKLGEGREAWAALGLRWAVPGIGYGAYEAANPGSLTLTAGERDREGAFTHRAALAASYSKDETSDRYRIEGMEGSGPYGTSFRPTDLASLPAGFSAVETLDSQLKDRFPDLVSNFHRGVSSQQALKLTASEAWGATLVKLVDRPSYGSFGSFSFFLKTSAGSGSLSLALDEGTDLGGKAVALEVGLGDFSSSELGVWRRIVVKYGDTRLYVQDEEGGSLKAIGALSSAFDATSGASRIRIEVSGAAAGQEIWIDELLLEDSVGREALLFQGELAYSDAELVMGEGRLPLLQGLDLKADLSAGLHRDSYASGGASVATNLGPLGLKLKARGSASAGARAAASGGHELRLPAQSFPARLTDAFDFDPATGAFGKQDALALAAGGAASLELGQKSTWTPGTAAAPGSLEQEWTGALSGIDGRISLKAQASSKARPERGPGLDGAGYAEAWIDSFAYLLPAFEPDAARRKESLALSASLRPGAELLSASAAVVAEPTDSDSGTRRNQLVARISAPLAFGRISVSPYYKRSWSDKRSGCGSGFADDLDLALGDFGSFGPFYSPVPLRDLALPSDLASFARATDAEGLEAASFCPEAGLILSRGFGSYWYDLVAPASLAFAFRRELERSGDSLTRAGVWEATAKSAALNLFGSQGAYPSTGAFDSDEYQSTLQATLRSVDGESSPRIKIQAQQLVTFLSGEYDALNAQNRLYVSTIPAKREWSDSFSLELTRRAERHWLLDLYRLVLPGRAAPPAEGAEGPGEAKPRLSIVSAYLEELSAGTPIARNSAGLSVSVKRTVTDDSVPPFSWALEEYYEGKLSLPERLTLKAKASLSQARDGEEELLSFGGSLSLGLTISF